MVRRPQVEVYSDPESLAEAAAIRFARAAAGAVRERGRFVVALAGGSTPKELYRLLAGEPFVSQIPWPSLHVGWGDERSVPPDDPASNYRMAHEALLAHVPVPGDHVHRIRGEEEPEAAARAYEHELRELLATPSGPPSDSPGARFDLVLLGLGNDGHTASIFPGGSALGEDRRWAVAQEVAQEAASGAGGGSQWRVTLTPEVINSAGEVIFLVSGGAKASALRGVLGGPFRPEVLPAQAIAPRAGGPLWLVDRHAAGG